MTTRVPLTGELAITLGRWDVWAFLMTYLAALVVWVYPAAVDVRVEWGWDEFLMATVEGGGLLGLLVSSAVAISVVGSEFTWRTAMQNVAHGWSRLTLLVRKVQQVVIVSLMFWLGTIGVVAIFSLTSSRGPVRDPSMAGIVAVGYLAALTGFGILALAVVLLFRQTAVSMGAWLLYVLGLESELWKWFSAISDTGSDSLSLLPAFLLRSLLNPATYDDFNGARGTLTWTAAYVMVALAVSWWQLERRDLV